MFSIERLAPAVTIMLCLLVFSCSSGPERAWESYPSHDPAGQKIADALPVGPKNGGLPGLEGLPADVRRSLEELEKKGVVKSAQVKTQEALVEARAHYNKGVDLFNQLDYDEAKKEFERIIEITRWAPHHPDLSGYRERVEAYIHRCNKLKGLESLRRPRAIQKKAASIAVTEERARRRAEGKPAKPPSSGIFFNDKSAGDLRGRTEGLYGSHEKSAKKRKAAHFNVRMLRKAYKAWARRDVTVRSGAEEAMPPGKSEVGVTFRGLGNEVGGAEAYNPIVDNPFHSPLVSPLSTFSIDVDTASYANMRRFLQSDRLPPADAVRLEELVNYFHYDYEGPKDGAPFAVHMEVNECPWNPGNRLVRIGLKGKSMANEERPPANLVFLLDVSGSMHDSNKLPLLKRAMKLLVERLGSRDRVAIVTYASDARLALGSTPCDRKETILKVIDGLFASGSTHWSAGLEIAYREAAGNFLEKGINRVILASDGDFNVGVTSQGGIVRLIEEKAKDGVFLTALGFGMGNYKDANMEALADKGNGNAAYIDGFEEAKKVFIEGLAGTLHAIAKDVKIQVEFNPVRVSAYRLVGYANRLLRAEDFNDDRKDAGEIGAGHVVTAFYEIVPAEVGAAVAKVDPLRYQDGSRFTNAAYSGETFSLKLRYKEPRGAKSRLLCFTASDAGSVLSQASSDHRFACAVASFGMLLRNSPFRGTATYESVLRLAEENRSMDIHGRRAEFVSLVRKAAELARAMVGKR